MALVFRYYLYRTLAITSPTTTSLFPDHARQKLNTSSFPSSDTVGIYNPAWLITSITAPIGVLPVNDASTRNVVIYEPIVPVVIEKAGD